MRTALRLLLGALLAGLLPSSTPAALANHDNVSGHWNQPPAVVTPHGGLDAVIQDAAYYWQDHAFHRGYYPPLPQPATYGCAPHVGRITICWAPRHGIDLQGDHGITRAYYYGDGSGHIAAKVIWIADDLSGYGLQQTMRHEWGHALGLDHRNRPGSSHPLACSLMNTFPCGMYATWEDLSGVAVWQPQNHGPH